MRKLTYTLGAMVLAAAMATPAHAALITIGIRAIGVGGGAVLTNANNVSVSATGQTITLQLYADIQDNDGNAQNDGVLTEIFSVLSQDLGGGTTNGNLGNTSPNFIAYDASQSQSLSAQPAQANLDADGDLELGSTNNASATGWGQATGASSPNETFGTGPTTGAPALTEFILGTTTWTATSVGADSSNIVMALRKVAGATGHLYKFESDGTTFALGGTDANVAVGGGVLVSVPEPATIGLLGMALAGIALRRNRNKVA